MGVGGREEWGLRSGVGGMRDEERGLRIGGVNEWRSDGVEDWRVGM